MNAEQKTSVRYLMELLNKAKMKPIIQHLSYDTGNVVSPLVNLLTQIMGNCQLFPAINSSILLY